MTLDEKDMNLNQTTHRSSLDRISVEINSHTQASGSGQQLKIVPDYLAPVTKDSLATGKAAKRLADFIADPKLRHKSDLSKTASTIIRNATAEAKGLVPKSNSGDIVKDLFKLRTVLAGLSNKASGQDTVYKLQKQATRSARDIMGARNPHVLSQLIFRKEANPAPAFSEQVSKEILFEKIDSMHAWASPIKNNRTDVPTAVGKQRKDVKVILKEASKLAQKAQTEAEGSKAESQVVARMIAVAGEKVLPVMSSVAKWIEKNSGRADMNTLLTECNNLISTATQTWAKEKEIALRENQPGVEGAMEHASENVARTARERALNILEKHAGVLGTKERTDLKKALQTTYSEVRNISVEKSSVNNRLKSLIDSL